MAQRIAWPDVAKGVSIIGVIILHISLTVPGARETVVSEINTVTDPMRMPLFFLVSGLFATKIFAFSFRELWERRLWYLFVPYAVWVPVELWTKGIERRMGFGMEMPEPAFYLSQLVMGINMAWFLYALILFNVLLWLTRKMPTWLAVALSFAPIVLLPIHLEWHIAGKAILYLPIFFLGAYLRPHILKFAKNCFTPKILAATSGFYAVGLIIDLAWKQFTTTDEIAIVWLLPGMDYATNPEVELVVRLATHLLMLPAGITAAVALSKVPGLTRGLQFVGRNTLPLYLGHPIALTVLFNCLQHRLGFAVAPDAQNWFETTNFWFFACFVFAILGGLTLWLISKTPVLQWTMKPPAIGHQRAVTRVAHKHPVHVSTPATASADRIR